MKFTTAVLLFAAGMVWAQSDNAKGGYYEKGKGSKGGPTAEAVTMAEPSTLLELGALTSVVGIGAFLMSRRRA
jgi:hypothetical protein